MWHGFSFKYLLPFTVFYNKLSAMKFKRNIYKLDTFLAVVKGLEIFRIKVTFCVEKTRVT